MTRIVYGVHPVNALLDHPGRALRVLAAGRSQGIDAVARRAEAAGVPVEMVDRAVLDRLTDGGVHQGVAARAAPFPFSDLDTLFADPQPYDVILAFDEVTDPHNVGACLRTLEALGGRGAIIPAHRQAAVTPVTAKSSAGAIEHLALVQASNLVRALEKAVRAGFRVYGLGGDGPRRLDREAPGDPVVLVLGSEGRGLRPVVRAACDTVLSIPLAGRTGSLNVAAAAAVAVARFRLGDDKRNNP